VYFYLLMPWPLGERSTLLRNCSGHCITTLD